jgi:hypothetical protein
LEEENKDEEDDDDEEELGKRLNRIDRDGQQTVW